MRSGGGGNYVFPFRDLIFGMHLYHTINTLDTSLLQCAAYESRELFFV